MGLGSVREGGQSTFLTIAGGYIWDRKADKSNANFATQEFNRADGTVGERAGARYADLTGMVSKVEFRTHPQYGENINVTIVAGEDKFILSVSTNNRYSQDLMKVLLSADLTQPLFIKPYDFVGADKRRAMGISFRQNGEKLVLRVEGAPTKEGAWFKTAGSKNIKRFFEDLNEWYVNEVTNKVVGQTKEVEPVAVAKVAEVVVEKAVEAPVAAVVASDLDSQLENLFG